MSTPRAWAGHTGVAMRRITGVLAMVAALASACGAVARQPGEILVVNGGFEEREGEMPRGWSRSMWGGKGERALGDLTAEIVSTFAEQGGGEGNRQQAELQVRGRGTGAMP